MIGAVFGSWKGLFILFLVKYVVKLNTIIDILRTSFDFLSPSPNFY